MKRVLQRAGMAFLVMMLCLSMFTPAVYAADALAVEIPFSIELSGFIPSLEESYTVQLQAADEISPMPEGSVDGVYSMTVTGAGNYAFPEIVYLRVGVYAYKVMQLGGSDSFGVYDTDVFDVTVYVTNAEDGSGLEMTVVAYRQEEGAQKSDIVIQNFYKTPVNITAVKKWVDTGDIRPASVTIRLLKDGVEYESVVLDESNDWQHAWNRLSDEFTWTVEEVAVPEGYTVSYSTEGEVTTVTNTEIPTPPEHYYEETETETEEESEVEETETVETDPPADNTPSLIQTGQMFWPIVVLAVLGGALIVVGLLSMKKRNNTNA